MKVNEDAGIVTGEIDKVIDRRHHTKLTKEQIKEMQTQRDRIDTIHRGDILNIKMGFRLKEELQKVAINEGTNASELALELIESYVLQQRGKKVERPQETMSGDYIDIELFND